MSHKTPFNLPKVEDVETEDEARNLAIDWQNWQSEQNLSQGELAEYWAYFENLGLRFHLTDEFDENGIL